MTVDVQTLSAGGALALMAWLQFRINVARLQRLEERTEKSIDKLEVRIEALQLKLDSVNRKYGFAKGVIVAVKGCKTPGCQWAKILTDTPAHGIDMSEHDSDPANPKITS